MKSLHIRIQIWAMRRDHIGFDPETEEETHQCRREIAPRRASDEAGIVIEGEHGRPTMLAQELGYHLQQDFGIEVRSDLSMQPDRGAGVDEVGDLHDMLLLAIWIRGHTRGIFQIELDFFPGCRSSNGLGLRR